MATTTPTVTVTPANGDGSLSTTVVQPFRQPYEWRPPQIIPERHGVGKTRMGDEGGEDTHPNTPEKKEIDQRSSSTGIEKTEPAWIVRRAVRPSARKNHLLH